MKLDKDKWKALLGTIIFHGLVVLALMFLALSTPLPLPGEQGVEVSLGSSGTGLGNEAMRPPQETMKPKTLTKHLSQPGKPKPKPKPVVSKQENLTQNIEPAPALKKKEMPVKKQEKEKKDTARVIQKTTSSQKLRPKVNQRALFKLAPGTKIQGKGVAGGAGNQGTPYGFIKSKVFRGRGGRGQGISFSLGNRGAKYLAKPTASFSEQGTVVVRIEVNPQGKVVKASVYAKGTTVVSEKLRQMALKSAKNSLFSLDPSAPAVQIGTITYHFILKR